MISQFSNPIKQLDLRQIQQAHDIPSAFLLQIEGSLSSYYIPFEYINPSAKIVLVGITPGLTQWKNAMAEMQRQITLAASPEVALKEAKKSGAFSGPMRSNLIALLNTIGMQKWLKIASCESLFSTDANLVQTTSILRHPIFIDGANYNGKPSMIKTPFLREQIKAYFANEAKVLKDALYIPLGPTVSEGLELLVNERILNASQVLHGLPHPSGANAERIAYFIGKKERSSLSLKTNADKLDAIRERLTEQLANDSLSTN